MTFQFPTFEFFLIVALFVGRLLDVRYCAILMLLSVLLYFPRMFWRKPSNIELASQALAQARASPRPGLFSRHGAAAAAVAVLTYLAMIYLGIISQPRRRDAAALNVLFTFIFVTATFLVYYPSASVSASPTPNRDTETDKNKLTRFGVEYLRAALEAAGLSTEGDKKALVARLVAARRAALIETMSVGLRVVTLNGASGSIERLPEKGGWFKVRLDREEETVNLKLGDFSPVPALASSLLPFLKDCACAAGAAALSYILLDYLWIFILHLTSSAHWRSEATIFVLVGAGVYCLYRYLYCRTIPYKEPPTNVTNYKRAAGDRVRDYIEPPKTVEDFLARYGLDSLAPKVGHLTLEQLSLKSYEQLLELDLHDDNARAHVLAARLTNALKERPPGPTYFRDLLDQSKATGELPGALVKLEMIPGGSGVYDFLTKRERDLYKDTTGIEANSYKAPSLLDPPILHQLHRTAVARRDLYFETFHLENEARTLLELPWTRYRMDLLRARQETQTLSRKEVTELRDLEEALPGLEWQATARALAERGYVQEVPTEDRPEDWTKADWEGYYRTQEFLQKSRCEQREYLKDIVVKLTSCACEFGWAAAILALWALFEELFERGHYDEADRAFERLHRALVRVNFWYSREHFLLCNVPQDAVKAVVKETTAKSVESAGLREGIQVDLSWRQQVLGFPLRATQC